MALNLHVRVRPTKYVCVFVREVTRPVVGMLKGCVQHLEADSGRRWGDREEPMGGGTGFIQTR